MRSVRMTQFGPCYQRPAAAVLLALLVTACAENTKDPVASNAAPDEISDRIAAIRALGGAAVVVRAGTATYLEVIDPSSPIFGSAITVPANALPEGVDVALLSLVPAAAPGLSGNAVTLAGPAANAQLTSIETGLAIGLLAAATVAMPVSSAIAVSADSSLFRVAAFSDTGEPRQLAWDGYDPERSRVRGLTDSLGRFAAVLVTRPSDESPVANDTDDGRPAPASEDRLVYSVQGDATCTKAGQLASNGWVARVTYEIVAGPPDRQQLTISVAESGAEFLRYRVATTETSEVAPEAVTAIDPIATAEISAFDLYASCGIDTAAIAADPVTAPSDLDAIESRDVQLSYWRDDSFESGSCDGVPCIRRQGTVWVRLMLAFTMNSATPPTNATVSLDTVASAVWETPTE